MYKNFYDNYNDSLKTAFKWLKSANINELVLDLRYNNGGAISSVQYLGSLIAPTSAIANKSVILRTVYNSIITNYNNSRGYSNTTDFIDLGLTLNLNRIFILTGRNTASASEALIVGLRPYMSVVTIGAKTHGKYTGAYLINDSEGKHNWAIQPIVMKYSNSVGFTDFGNGLTADISSEEDKGLAKELGNPSERYFALAIQEITGIPAPTDKSISLSFGGDLIESFDGNRIRRDLPFNTKPLKISKADLKE
jgi:C-terminal processing protease CtpA/Prc